MPFPGFQQSKYIISEPKDANIVNVLYICINTIVSVEIWKSIGIVNITVGIIFVIRIIVIVIYIIDIISLIWVIRVIVVYIVGIISLCIVYLSLQNLHNPHRS